MPGRKEIVDRLESGHAAALQQFVSLRSAECFGVYEIKRID